MKQYFDIASSIVLLSQLDSLLFTFLNFVDFVLKVKSSIAITLAF